MPARRSSSEREPSTPGAGAKRPAHPQPVRLSALAATAGIPAPGASEADPLVTGVTLDSRAVRPGDLFAAVPGAHVHRAQFAAAAKSSGAVAVLTDPAGAERARGTGLPVVVAANPRAVLGDIAAHVYGRPGERMQTVAVTGTNGKTTTAYLIESGLRQAYAMTGLLGTIETRIGPDVLPSERTTPEAPDLHALLAVMLERGVGALAMEVSSHALRLGRVGGLVVDVALFTNLGRDHLDFHADLEDYFRAKASLFEPQRARHGVVNLDDPYGRRLAAEAAIEIITCSARGDRSATWVARDVRTGPRGSEFTAVGPSSEEQLCSVALPGRFNVENALGALVALVSLGLPLDRAAAGIAACPGVPGRLERVDVGQEFLALVDYAHTPDAVQTLLAAVRPLVTGRLITVLGCGGDRDADKRPAMGAAAARGADVVVVTDDNPRSEPPAAIRAAVLAGAREVPPAERAEVIEIADRHAAIEAAVATATGHDAVVVAGKGHERGQEVGAAVLPFDDREALRSAIAGRRSGRGDNDRVDAAGERGWAPC